jgi:hypothetical protein
MRGPYTPHDPELPAYGMGQNDVPQVGFGDEILREMLSATPLGAYVPWAQQVSDAEWSEIPQQWVFTCVPVSQQMLDEVKRAAFGHEVGWVGILFDQPATINAIERALHGTPYALDSSQAVYDLNYPGQIPRIRFLVWAQLRDMMPGDGAGGGTASMDVAAAALHGQLVYVIQGPVPAGAKRPTVNFNVALQQQLDQQRVEPSPELPYPITPPPGPLPGTPPPAEPAATAPVPAPPAPKAPTAALWYVALGMGAAALVAWWLGARKSTTPGRPMLPARGETGTY